MTTVCSHSIGTRLSRKLALFIMLVMAALFGLTWSGVGMLIKERNGQDLAQHCELLSDIMGSEARLGGEAAVLARLHLDAPMRPGNRLQVWRADGQLLYADGQLPAGASAAHRRIADFKVEAPSLQGGLLRARYEVDYARDAAMGRRWGLLLVVLTLAAGAVVAVGVRWHVRTQLRPLHDLAAQTLAISPSQLDRRLALTDPATELLPWIEQFNALMGRLEQAYTQLEGFNADVAHELRTPLANLIGQTEVALSRERSGESLRETLTSNLEEMQRLSAMVNDMLFLSQADRGAVARRGAPVSLAELARQVLDFHEAPLEDAGLSWQVLGDMTLAVDEGLFKRALSNLLGNATRFARRGSTVVVAIAAAGQVDPATGAQPVQVVVHNEGEPIDGSALPRLFDRFFRADASRCCDDSPHHGLGLAIVAAIARMHAGRTLAESADGRTQVGFTLAPG